MNFSVLFVCLSECGICSIFLCCTCVFRYICPCTCVQDQRKIWQPCSVTNWSQAGGPWAPMFFLSAAPHHPAKAILVFLWGLGSELRSAGCAASALLTTEPPLQPRFVFLRQDLTLAWPWVCDPASASKNWDYKHMPLHPASSQYWGLWSKNVPRLSRDLHFSHSSVLDLNHAHIVWICYN